MWAARHSGLVVPVPALWLATGARGVGATSPVTFNNTAPSDINCSLIIAEYTATAATPTVSASFGATSATLVTGGTVAITTATPFYYLSFFKVQWPSGPPSGSQTVSFTSSGAGLACSLNVLHYKNIASVGTAISVGNQSGQPSMSATSTIQSAIYAQAFGYRAAAAANTFSGYTQNQRDLVGATLGTNPPMIIGDAYGNGGTLTFGASRTSTTNPYGGMIVPLLAA